MGAANFTGLEAPRRILAELRAECAARGIKAVADVRGLRSDPDDLTAATLGRSFRRVPKKTS